MLVNMTFFSPRRAISEENKMEARLLSELFLISFPVSPMANVFMQKSISPSFFLLCLDACPLGSLARSLSHTLYTPIETLSICSHARAHGRWWRVYRAAN